VHIKNFVLLAVLTVGLFVVTNGAIAAPPTVLLDGKTMQFAEVEPVVENGYTMVPFRAIFEALGADVGWDQNNASVSATKGDINIIMHLGDEVAAKNGAAVNMGAAPTVLNDHILVPLRFVSVALGARVGWYNDCYLITISTNDSVGKGKKVALTFDDGPDSIYTGQILDVLKKQNAVATFFLLGNNTEKYPEVAKRIHTEGHEVGIHSYDHPNFAKMSKEAVFTDQIEKTQAIFKSIIGIEPIIYRPPYSSITKEQLVYLNSKGYVQVLWKVNTEDYDPKVNTPAHIVARALEYGKNGGIIIMHSTNGDHTTDGDMSNTVNALPVIIEEFRQQGMEICGISQISSESYNSQHYNGME